MAGKGGPTSSFVDLPEDIHFEIAKIIDPRLCSSPSSQHASDPDFIDKIYSHCKPDLALARLTLVCKRLHHIYAPLSTWRSLCIKVMPFGVAKLGKMYEPSPSLTRVLEHPETGIHARELLIGYTCTPSDWDGFMHCGNLVGLGQLLANTPLLDTVRCIYWGGNTGRSRYCNVCLPYEFFESLSSLTYLRYLSLDQFYLEFFTGMFAFKFPSLRILRFSPASSSTSFFKDILRFSIPNIHTLYVYDGCGPVWRSTNYSAKNTLDAIEVRCHVPPFILS
jgi:hypothetical protein